MNGGTERSWSKDLFMFLTLARPPLCPWSGDLNIPTESSVSSEWVTVDQRQKIKRKSCFRRPGESNASVHPLREVPSFLKPSVSGWQRKSVQEVHLWISMFSFHNPPVVSFVFSERESWDQWGIYTCVSLLGGTNSVVWLLLFVFN